MGVEKGCHYLWCTKTVSAENAIFRVLQQNTAIGEQGCNLHKTRKSSKAVVGEFRAWLVRAVCRANSEQIPSELRVPSNFRANSQQIQSNSEQASQTLYFFVMGSQHPSPHVTTLCNFEPQIWPEVITSRDAESTCFKGSRTSCDVIIFGFFKAKFWPENIISRDGCFLFPCHLCNKSPCWLTIRNTLALGVKPTMRGT